MAHGIRKSSKKDMPDFLKQDRPEGVKKIYRALKREHPDMPAEMKARIASRQGKPGKQKQGPPYKAPLSKKSVAGGLAHSEGLRESDVCPKQLEAGIKVEMEHTSDKEKAKRIALDHLAEHPEYYTALKEMESELEAKESSVCPKAAKKLVAYVKATPDLDDDQFHAYDEKLGVDPHDAEEVVYAALRKSSWAYRLGLAANRE